MSKTIRNFKRFQYFEEDCRCEHCRHDTRKGKGKKRGCNRAAYRCEHIRADAIAKGRVKRERGWGKRQMSTGETLWDG